MRTILDVLRLRLEVGLSERRTARSLGVPRSSVQDYLARFRVSGLTWPLAPAVDDAALARAVQLRRAAARGPAPPAGLGHHRVGEETQRRDAASALAGVPERRARGIQLQSVRRPSLALAPPRSIRRCARSIAPVNAPLSTTRG